MCVCVCLVKEEAESSVVIETYPAEKKTLIKVMAEKWMMMVMTVMMMVVMMVMMVVMVMVLPYHITHPFSLHLAALSSLTRSCLYHTSPPSGHLSHPPHLTICLPSLMLSCQFSPSFARTLPSALTHLHIQNNSAALPAFSRSFYLPYTPKVKVLHSTLL